MPDLSLSGRLPSGDHNGLAAQLSELLAEPKAPRVAIVAYDVGKITTDSDSGEQTPTIRIRAIEPITPTDDAAEIKRLLRRAAERRTGKAELPLDLERALDEITEPGDDSGGEDDGP
jgi:hypothetical protein